METIVPGTFVPDITPGTPESEPLSARGAGAAGASFKETLQSALAEVNDKMVASDRLSQELATGRTNDIDKVVTSVEEANLALSFTLAVRNKLLQAYQEISQMQM